MGLAILIVYDTEYTRIVFEASAYQTDSYV